MIYQHKDSTQDPEEATRWLFELSEWIGALTLKDVSHGIAINIDIHTNKE